MNYKIECLEVDDYFIDAEIEVTDYHLEKAEPDVGFMVDYYAIDNFEVLSYEVLDKCAEPYILFSVFDIKRKLNDYVFSTIQEQFNERME